MIFYACEDRCTMLYISTTTLQCHDYYSNYCYHTYCVLVNTFCLPYIISYPKNSTIAQADKGEQQYQTKDSTSAAG